MGTMLNNFDGRNSGWHYFTLGNLFFPFFHYQEKIKLFVFDLHHFQPSFMFSFLIVYALLCTWTSYNLSFEHPQTFLKLDKVCPLLRVLGDGYWFSTVLLWDFSLLELDGLMSCILNHDSELLQIKYPHKCNSSGAHRRGNTGTSLTPGTLVSRSSLE